MRGRAQQGDLQVGQEAQGGRAARGGAPLPRRHAQPPQARPRRLPHHPQVRTAPPRFTDGRETVKVIKGSWRGDVLANGLVIDESGEQRTILGNILANRSKRQLPGVEANKTIYLQTQRLAQRRPSSVKPSQQDSKESVVSILDR